MKKLLVTLSFLFLTVVFYGQGATCPNVEPFCAGGSSLTFNNQTGVPSLGTIGCNGTTPNPAWFYMQISQGGNLNFQISQTSNAGTPIDVDFIAWGPFPPGSTPADFCPVLQTNCAPVSCPNNTSQPNFYPNGNIIDCSYSGNAVENMTITGAQAGEIYVVLITNFNGAPGQITMTQTNTLAPNAGTTDCNIVCPLTLGEDQIICPGGAIFLEATIADATSYAWYLNGDLIPSATGQSYIATQTGTYTVVVNKPGCVANATDSVVLMDPPAANIGTPNDLEFCGPGPGIFNLNSNSGILLNSLFGDITYHLTLEDAQLGAAPIGGASNFSSNGQTIYAAIQIDGDPCIVTSSFELIILDCTLDPQPTTIPGLCDANGDGFEIFDLTQADANALNGLPASQHTVTYHNTFAGATTGTPFIANPATYNGTDGEVIYIRVQNNTNAAINGTTQITLTVIPVPTPDTLSDVTVCDSYELPTLVVGNYFTSPNGLGTPLNAGDPITTTTQLYIYAETGTTPNCFAETSFTVTVNQTPQVSTPADEVSCGPYELPSLAVGNYYSAPAGGGIQYTAGDVIATTTTLYVYAETGTTPNCFTEHVFTVSIVSPPTIFDPADLVLCDDDNNGLATFDLTQAIAQITGNQPNLVVTFHETETDALLGVTPITNPSAYPMLTINTQIIYINVKETGAGASDCSAFTTLTLIVNPRPELNNAIPNYELCDYDNPGDGVEVFDLTTMYNQITNNQPGLTLTYAYDNGGVLTTIGTPTAFANTTPGEQTIFVTAENTFGCTTTTQFNVVVNPLPTVFAPDPLFICSEGSNTETGPFDLTIRNNQITGALTGFTVSYHLTLNDAIQEIGALQIPYTNTVNGQVVYVRVENNDTGCFTTTTLQLNVVPGPVANTPTPLTYCDPNNDNVGIFDLTSVANQVTGGAATSEISYHETFTDADLGVTPILNPANYSTLTPTSGIQIVYIRVRSTLTGCYAVVELVLQVNPTPVLVETALPLEVCDDNADGIAVFDLTTAIPNILNGLNPALHTVSFHFSEVQAQDNTNPIANVLSFSNSTPNQQIIWVRVAITATGCFKVIPLTLTVNPKPVLPLSLPSFSLCETDPTDEREIFAIRDYVTAQLPAPGYQFAFYFSEADADNNQSPLPDNYENLTNPQTIWIVVTNETTGCSNKTVLDLRVEPRPILQLPLGGLTLCDDNGEGFGNFDLTAEVNNLLNGATGVNVTFYDTLENAELAVDAISSPYENITAYLQFIYIRAENAVTGCYSTYTLALNVNPSPIIPVDLPNLTLCDQDSNPQSGTTSFDLTQQNAIILAAQPAGLGSYTIRYFTTEADAQNNTAAIVPASNYINTTSPQTIWYRVSNNTSNCFSIGTFQLIVNTPLALTTPTPLAQCNPDNDNFMEFDLTTKDAEITQNLPGYTVTYYPSYAQALSETGPITNPTAYTNLTPAQTLGVVVTSPQGCKSFISLTIRVLPTPIVNTPPLLEVCDNTNPGDNEEAFDLTTHENIIRNNDPDITFAYFPTQADAIAGTNQIMAPTTYVSATGSVWVMAMNQQQPTPGTFCYTLVEQLLQVNPLPQLVAFIPDYVICEPNTDNIATFTLNTLNDQVMESGDATGFTISYYETQADATAGTNALANSYANTSNPQTIYIRVVNNQTGCVNATATVNLVVEEGAIANPIPADTAGLTVCDEDGTNDGQTQFDLTPFGAIALGTQSPTDYAVSYYETQADALAGTNAIANPSNYTNTNNPQEIWIRVTNTTTVSQCSALSSIQLTVNLLPEITLNDGFICVDPVTLTPLGTYTIDTNIANPELYSYVWYFNGDEILGATDSSYTTTEAGTYEVVATNIATGCSMLSPAMMTLTNTSAAIVTDADVVVSGAFSQNQTITVNVTGGLGDYEYQLDNGPFQDSNVFTNVSAGTHIITIRDKNDGGCDTVVIIKTAINYPLFFTPNGDNHNDTWNITGLGNQPNAKIYIFDRYGKLLKQISPTSNGWDGTFNGQPMPSTDYWFTVTFEENNETKEFKAHFSLKR